MNISPDPDRPGMRSAQIMQVSFLVFIGAYVGILIGLQSVGPRAGTLDPQSLNLLEIVLAALSVWEIALAFLLPGLVKKLFKPSSWQEGYTLAYIFLPRSALLQSVSIYGLVLGIAGAGWDVVDAFFIVSAALSMATFPTPERWDKLKKRA